MSHIKELREFGGHRAGASPASAPGGERCCGPQRSGAQGGGPACCPPESDTRQSNVPACGRQRLDIELLYVDLSVCTRCQGAEASLEEAISEVGRVLEATGVEVSVRKIHVRSEEEARELGFFSSPTIRLNGRDIQWDVRESRCDCCSQLADEDVDCRVWVYCGEEYTVPPKPMIVEAILREVYGGGGGPPEPPVRTKDVPDNLKHFWAASRKRTTGEESAPPPPPAEPVPSGHT